MKTDILRAVLASRHRQLGLADEVFAVFIGATLVLSFAGWQAHSPRILTSILMTISIVTALAVAASNESRIVRRFLIYALVLTFTFMGILWITHVARHDISVEVSDELRAFPIGVLVWICVRELAVVIMNLLRVKTDQA